MKTWFKHTLSCVATGLLLLYVTGISAQDTAGFYTVSGVVKDQKTGKKLEYVNISVPGTNIGTVTNKDGKFVLKLKKSLSVNAIEISHIGYLNYRQSLEGKNEVMTFRLIPSSVLLNEVVVGNEEAKNIVAAAMDRIGTNYAGKNAMLTAFYRETTQKERRYIHISEAIIHTFKTPYTENTYNDRVQVYKGRKLLSQKANDTLAVKLMGGPTLAVYGDVVKNPDLLLDKNTLSLFTYEMGEPTTIDDRPQYVIHFMPLAKLPYPLYYGVFYIDKENLAFTRTEFSLDMTNRAEVTKVILKKKPLGLRFKPITLSFLVIYKQREGKSYLNYIRNELKFKCDWKRKLFSTHYTIVSEMVVTESQEQNVTAIPYKVSFKRGQVLSDKVTDFFDEDFWGDYNIIEPTESLESAVRKLKKQYN